MWDFRSKATTLSSKQSPQAQQSLRNSQDDADFFFVYYFNTFNSAL